MAATMTVDQAIAKAFLHAQRKPVSPSSGTTKYNALLMIADSMQKMWASEPGIEWDSLYSKVTLSTLVSATDTFPIDLTINDISQREGDFIQVTNGTNTSTFTAVDPDQLQIFQYKAVCARMGNTLKFSQPFQATDSRIGYNIVIPAIGYIADITTGSNIVAVDDPMWLVYMMAAEFCRNDVVKAGQYDNLLNMADIHMQKMKQANGGQREQVALPWRPQGANWS